MIRLKYIFLKIFIVSLGEFAIQNVIEFFNIVIFIIELHVKPFIKGWENNEILNHLNWKVFVYVF